MSGPEFQRAREGSMQAAGIEARWFLRRQGHRQLPLTLLVALSVLASCAAPAPGPRDASGGASQAVAPSQAAAPTGRAAYPAEADTEVKVRASWCAAAGAMFPLWVAKEAGIFTRHRLDVDLVYAFGSEVNIAALMQGELDFVECAGASQIPGMMAASDMVLIASFLQGNPYRLITLPELQRVQDLRGRKLAIGRAGGFDNRLLETMLERHGLVPNQDVTLVPIGNQTDRYNALKIGAVDAISVNPPVNLTLQSEGFREVFDLGSLGISGVYISLTATKRLIETRPRVAERFLAAMMEAEAYARVNREFTIQVMSDYLKLTNRQALEGAYEAYAGDQLAIPPYVPSDGVQAVIDETLRANATAVVREAALLVDNRPLQAVEATGYVDALLAEYGLSRN
jgi:NitT/TauT family transport system substrate-binding protein